VDSIPVFWAGHICLGVVFPLAELAFHHRFGVEPVLPGAAFRTAFLFVNQEGEVSNFCVSWIVALPHVTWVKVVHGRSVEKSTQTTLTQTEL
jgi:hypothetical protein